MPAYVDVPVWLRTDYLRNHVPKIRVPVEGGADVGEEMTPQYVPFEDIVGGTNVIITVGSGLLPASDLKIAIIAPWGSIPPLSDAFTDQISFTSDRVSTPNEIIFSEPVPEGTNLVILLFYPVV